MTERQKRPQRSLKDIREDTERIRTTEYTDPRYAGIVNAHLEDAYTLALAIKNGEIDPSEAAVIMAINKAKAEKDSIIDKMMGLYSKDKFESEFEKELARAKRLGTSTAVAYLDLDDFSLVNNQESHEHGHAVLAAVGTVLRSEIREYDLAGRCGGEEIVLALSNTTENQALERLIGITQNLPDRVIAGLNQRGIPFDRSITASVGVAEITFDDPLSETPTTVVMRNLLDTADQRMRMAKVAGKNKIVGTLEEEEFRKNDELMNIGKTGKYRIH